MTDPHDTTPQGDPERGADEAVEQGTPEAGEPRDAAAASGGPRPGAQAGTETGDTPGDEGGDNALEDELTTTRMALAELTTDLQRLQAEYVNYKRRVDRDRDLVRENATFSVLGALLPVLDDIERADEHGELTGGFKAVADSLQKVLGGLGLVRYGAKGDEFDPNIHEALMHGHSPEVTTTTVDVVAQPGYRVGERVVRVAKVTVLDPEE